MTHRSQSMHWRGPARLQAFTALALGAATLSGRLARSPWRRARAGIDGEAAKLELPLRFRTRPSALKVRVARAHSGAAPSAIEPDGVWDGLRALAAIAVGRAPRHGRLRLTEPGQSASAEFRG